MKRISKKDWNNVEDTVKNELSDREGCEFRKDHEKIWTEVDRQVNMKSMDRVNRGDEEKWKNVLELGELTKASEVWSADVRRLTFPQNRKWFVAHTDIPGELDPNTGDQIFDTQLQRDVDGNVRALMAQQHIDFGLKSRVDLSVKEALHHGSYVATVGWESQVLNSQKGLQIKAAPVWVPHSMWDCYPDPSPSIIGNPFYQGSMIIKSTLPAYRIKLLKSPDPEYPYFNLDTVKYKDETEDIDIIYRYGDLIIERTGKNVFLPNCRVILANERIIHYRPNPMPFPEVIYNGYERLDIRDPYYVSPVVKMSPMQKMGSILANQLLDSIDLKVEPPVAYNSNDPEFIRNGGPSMAPGAKNAHKGSADIKTLDVGDPEYALQGLMFIMQQIQSGTAVGGPRTGVASGTEQTATEVATISQGAEVRTVDFVDKHELHGLMPFLYMQHELNKLNLKNYGYFNPEPGMQPWNMMSKEDIQYDIGFDVTGSKSILGEQRRAQGLAQVTSFWKSVNPQLVNDYETAKEMYMDAGVRDPDRFINIPDDEKQQMMQQVEQLVQQFQGEISQLNQEIAEFDMQDAEHSLELEQKDLEKEQLQTTIAKLNAILSIVTKEKQVGRENESVSS